MILNDAAFEETCRHDFAYNKGILMGALYFLTRKVLQEIIPLEDAPKPRRIIPIKLVSEVAACSHS